MGIMQMILWGSAMEQIANSKIILAIRILLAIFSLFFWYRKQNWLTAAFLIIAGTAAGPLYAYFFLFIPGTLIGCIITLIGAFIIDKIFHLSKFISRCAIIPTLNPCRKAFWTPGFIICLGLPLAAGIFYLFYAYEFPLGAKPQPYVVSGWGWIGGKPPYKFDVSITMADMDKGYDKADTAATCMAAARYLAIEYGFPSVMASVLDYDYPASSRALSWIIGRCDYTPDAQESGRHGQEAPPVWSNFKVARSYPAEKIKKANKWLEESKENDWGTRQMQMERKFHIDAGYLPMQDVIYRILPNGLYEKPLKNSYGSGWMTRPELIAQAKSIFNELQTIGKAEEFGECIRLRKVKKTCHNKFFQKWIQGRNEFEENRKGNFENFITPFNKSLTDLEEAYANNDHERIEAGLKDMREIFAGYEKDMN